MEPYLGWGWGGYEGEWFDEIRLTKMANKYSYMDKT